MADSESLRKKVGEALDADIALAEMTRDELYAVVALDEAYEAGNVEHAQYQERRAELLSQLAANWAAPESRM